MKNSLITLFLLASSILSAQNYCGTQLSNEQKAWLSEFQANYTNAGSRGEEILYVPLQIHIVGNDDGSGYMPLSTVLQDICNLNIQYEAAGMYFYIEGDVNYINNTSYFIHDWTDGYSMMATNNVNGRANIYFVNDPAGNCGYFSPSGDALAVANSCSGIGNSTIAHELGHFFSLPHTFDGWEYGTPSASNQERVDGSNCEAAGDGFCDTPADYASYRWFCATPPTFTDPDGVEFTPDGSYYMSYSDDGCQTQFSIEQIAAMRSYLQSWRSELLVHPEVTFTDIESTNLISPEDGTFSEIYNHIVFTWDGVENATGYNLQVAYNITFSALALDMYTPDSFFVATTLGADKSYRWRVKPVAEANTCEVTTESRLFTTGVQFTAIENHEPDTKIQIFPNPVINGSVINISNEQEGLNIKHISVTDFQGKEVYSVNIPENAQHLIQLHLPQIASGMYAIILFDGQTSQVNKIIVQ